MGRAGMVREHGFPHLDGALGDGVAAKGHYRAWRGALADTLGIPCPPISKLHVLAAMAGPEAFAARCAQLHRTIAQGFGVEPGQLAVTVLPNHDAYYRYTSFYRGEGAHAISAGVFIASPVAQIALPAGDLRELEPTLAHELVHATLSRWELPRWLDEGLAQSVSRRVLGLPARAFSSEERANAAAWFTTHGVDGLFSGATFRDVEATHEAYLLSELLALSLQQRPGFLAFLERVRPMGAAEAALRYLDADLAGQAHAVVARMKPAYVPPPVAIPAHSPPDPAAFATTTRPARRTNGMGFIVGIVLTAIIAIAFAAAGRC